jgi:hypothetical protein
MIEENVGRESMDKFLKKYFKDHKFQTIVTEEFISYLKKYLLEENNYKLNINEWIFAPGIPANCPKVKSVRFVNAVDLVDDFMISGAISLKEKTADWSTHEWLHFIKHLPRDINVDQLSDLDKVFNFSNSGNSEILALWFLQCIKTDYQPAFKNLEKFLIKIGRRKFLQPLYLELSKSKKHKIWAREVYEKARGNYHFVSFNTIDKILK